jgi:hypothetical protein
LIKAVRALLLTCCIVALISAIFAGNSWVGLRKSEATRLPIVPVTIVEDVGSVTDTSKLKALCVALAGAIKDEASEREARYRGFTDMARTLIVFAMVFSVVAALVLLVAWLALGKAAREMNAMLESKNKV